MTVQLKPMPQRLSDFEYQKLSFAEKAVALVHSYAPMHAGAGSAACSIPGGRAGAQDQGHLQGMCKRAGQELLPGDGRGSGGRKIKQATALGASDTWPPAVPSRSPIRLPCGF
jgi:hypothetical protein